MADQFYPTNPKQQAGNKVWRTIKKVLLWGTGIIVGLFVLLIVLVLSIPTPDPSFSYTEAASGAGTPNPVVEVNSTVPPRATVAVGGQKVKADGNGNAVLVFKAVDLVSGQNQLKAVVTTGGSKSAEFPFTVTKPDFPLFLKAVSQEGSIKDGMYTAEVKVETEPGAEVTVAGQKLKVDSGQTTLALPVELSVGSQKVTVDAVTRDQRKSKVDVELVLPSTVPLQVQDDFFKAPVLDKSVTLRGQTVTGASVTVNGNPTKVESNGQFSFELVLAKAQSYDLTISATVPGSSLKQTTLTKQVVRKLKPAPITAELIGPTNTTADSVELRVHTVVGAQLHINGVLWDVRGTKHEEESVTYYFPKGFEGKQELEVRALHPDYEVGTSRVTVTRTISDAERKAAARESFIKGVNRDITPRHLTKNADRYSGQKVAIRGRILQIAEQGKKTRMLVETEYLGYDVWGDPMVYLTYDGTTDYLEDQVISIYGTVEGDFTYDTKIGGQNTVPHVVIQFFN